MRADATRAAQVLIDHPGFDVNGLNASGESPLMLAAIKGEVALGRRLIERGARIDLPGWAPLHYAASGPTSEWVVLLLERSARVDAQAPNGTTALMMAARYGSFDSVELLLDRGADAARRNQRGDLTPADFAAKAGRDRLAHSLRQRAGARR